MKNTVLRLFNRITHYKKINDISTHKEIYSLSLEVTGYTGPLIQIKKDDDTNPLDIYPLQNGLIDTQTIINHVGVVDTYHVSIIYGQKLFANATAVLAKRGVIAIAGVIEKANGYPAIYFNGTSTTYSATLPYANTTENVSITSVFKTDDVTGAQVVVGTTNILQGFNLYLNSSIPFSLAYKSSQDLVQSTSISAGGTYCITMTQSETAMAIYLDGTLKDSKTATYTDYVVAGSLQIGAWGGASSYWAGYFQFTAVSLSIEDANAAEIYTQLNGRFNIDGTNTVVPYINTDTTGVYISEIPAVLPNGESASGRIVGDIKFSEFMNFFAWTNLPKSVIGNIDISNNDSKFNSLVTGDYNYMELYNYDSIADVLTQFATSETDNIGYIENGRIRVTPKPVQERLNQALPTELFDGTYPNLENEKKLMCLGECSLVAPKILSAATDTYFISDSIYSVVTVYDEGKSVLFTQTSDGFILTATPNGKILCLVQGLSDGAGSYEKHFSEHIPRLLLKSGVDYNATDLTTIHPTIDSSWSGTNESIGFAITKLVNSFNTYYYFEADGIMRFGLLANPTSPTDSLTGKEIFGEIKAFKDKSKIISETFLSDPNYNQYSDSEIVYTALEADKINFVKLFSVTTTGTGLDNFYKTNNPDMDSHSLGGQTTGQVILDERIALWANLRFFYTFSTARDFDMNEVITITDSLKGLEAGKDVLIIGKGVDSRTNKTEYWAWG